MQIRDNFDGILYVFSLTKPIMNICRFDNACAAIERAAQVPGLRLDFLHQSVC